MTMSKVINFAAGPAKLPPTVLAKAQAELLDYEGCGMSVMELSHRGKEFTKIIKDAEADIRELMAIPDNYSILFLQGGATTNFAALPLNLAGPEDTVDYMITGSWSKKAAEEATKYVKNVNKVLPKPANGFTEIPDKSEWSLSPDAKYVYYCDNETVHGVEFSTVPETNGVPLIADMSSNFLSRPVDVTKFAVIYGGAQKNIGPAGMTIVIIRNDLLGNAQAITPTMLDYSVMAKNGSMYNTPPCFAIYMAGLVFRYLIDNGGLAAYSKKSDAKSGALYRAIDGSDGFYRAPVEEKSRSRMNIPFRLSKEELEPVFLEEAAKKGMVQLKGHRSVGGIRASIYNAITEEEVSTLIDFMDEFKTTHA
ncbi:phosphoserine aminotransferase, chloroplastic [Sphaeroforma arctica JP610]|uniref:phosphoserine transaminase n=1 Tax=Sphaeroforma arctica JP610 TaxID=667725 RepID=A0A0L0G1A6_9EUKA|nr:phosphoserine aminotransferase, chloroplastic [Sphaeroforma arctica JP610]KNC81988.1 phosphoserine aminotransferase, chloroplastic [Sphaeroforma arctica JP610]|eukprot:XP_014155890.1 phosphoserine aminotransferase, chloroplastic [Sphaeroforma arctica JP610]